MSDDRISQIQTQTELDVARYARAVRKYAGALLRDDDAADEVSHQFLFEMQRGGLSLRWYRSPAERRLPFRRFLKRALFWATRQFLQGRVRKGKRHWQLDVDALEVDQAPDDPSSEGVWEDEVRHEVIAAAWRGLEEHERRHPQGQAATLARLRAAAPGATAAQLADRLQEETGRQVEDDHLRKMLERMREQFARCLVQEARRRLSPAGLDDLPERETFQQELRDLRLLGYFHGLPEPSP